MSPINGNGNGKKIGNLNLSFPNNNLEANTEEAIRDSKSYKIVAPKKFKSRIYGQQSQLWSRWIIWTIMGVAVFGTTWAAFAKMEQVIPATGQLKPQAKVKEIQAPINGVVKEVFVEDGQRVEKDQLLVLFDTTAAKAQLESQEKVLNYLNQETKFYRTLMQQPFTNAQVDEAVRNLKLPQEVAALAKNRSELVEENQMFKSFLDNSLIDRNLSPEQQARLQATRAELNSRASAASLEVEQLQKQLRQNEVKLADARQKLATDRQVLAQIRARNEDLIKQAEQSLKIEQGILGQVEPLREEGAIATIQIERQRQEVNDRYARLIEQSSQGRIDYDNQAQQVETRQAEIDELVQEQNRLQLAIAQANQQLANTKALSEKEIRDRMAQNQQQIAQIDSQLTKLVVDNEKRIAELNSEISSTQQTLKYQELRSPVAGTVFDLQAGPGFVPQPSQAEALLKIVPDDGLIAEVYVTNKDIGFVRARHGEQPGQNVDVRIDSFPFSEFGDIKGEVIFVGSDALPPDQIHNYYRFPIKIKLDKQYLEVKNRQINLQSGMSITANIKINENRSVLSIFTDLFTDKVDSLKEVR